uniref:Uncharacterized protein n=1 Tax=Auxenochlorella protothecoides TaxID=3075 RepID=A0A1D2A265_AUXPR
MCPAPVPRHARSSGQVPCAETSTCRWAAGRHVGRPDPCSCSQCHSPHLGVPSRGGGSGGLRGRLCRREHGVSGRAPVGLGACGAVPGGQRATARGDRPAIHRRLCRALRTLPPVHGRAERGGGAADLFWRHPPFVPRPAPAPSVPALRPAGLRPGAEAPPLRQSEGRRARLQLRSGPRRGPRGRGFVAGSRCPGAHTGCSRGCSPLPRALLPLPLWRGAAPGGRARGPRRQRRLRGKRGVQPLPWAAPVRTGVHAPPGPCGLVAHRGGGPCGGPPGKRESGGRHRRHAEGHCTPCQAAHRAPSLTWRAISQWCAHHLCCPWRGPPRGMSRIISGTLVGLLPTPSNHVPVSSDLCCSKIP